MEACPIIVFARAPEPGRVKTRLIPALGPLRAAALHRRMVRETLKKAVQAGVGPVTLCCHPDPQHPFFRECARRYGVTLTRQVGDDLGGRMARAFEIALQGAPHAILVGSDCPPLTSEDLRSAARHLQEGSDAVLMPAEDGGYTLIGLRTLDPALFDRMPWGEDTVYRETMKRMTVLGWRTAELTLRWDLDRPEDLVRLKALKKKMRGGTTLPRVGSNPA